MRKKILAIVMSLTMILVFMPSMAFAEGSQKVVASITFKPAETKIVYDYDCEQEKGFYLWGPEFIEGDSIEITYTDNTTTTYKLTEGDEEELWVNENDSDDAISMDDFSFSSSPIPVSAASGDLFTFEMEYSNVLTTGEVEFRTSNISKITYTPKSDKITLYKGVDEITEPDDNGGTVTYFDVRDAYDYLYGFWNDKVLIEYNDGTSPETLPLDEVRNWDYVTQGNGGYVSLPEAQLGTSWDVGNTYYIYLKANGKIDTTNKITVKIEANPYNNATFSFTQSQKYLYVFEADWLDYDPATDEYVLDDADTVVYAGSDGETLRFMLADGSIEEFEYGRTYNDPKYPDGWDGFVTTDASGNKSRLKRDVMIKDKQLRWTKDSNGHYINDTAELTYMGAVSDKPMVSYVGYQVWFDPNGGEGNANTGVPIGMSLNEMPDDFTGIQPTRDGYTFSGWYEKDQAGNLKPEPFNFDTKIYGETFLYAKWVENTPTPDPQPDPGPQPDPYTPVPATEENAIAVKANINDGVASVADISISETNQAASGNIAIIDLSKVTLDDKTAEIKEIELTKSTINNFISSDATGIEVRLSTGTAVMDKASLEAIASQATGGTVSLSIVTSSEAEKTMNDAQKAVFEGMEGALAIEVNLSSGGKAISDLNGGVFTIKVPFETEKLVRAWYVAEDGSKEATECTHDGKVAELMLTHCSHYVLEAYELPDNPLSVKGKTVTVKYSKLKMKAQTLKASKLYKFTSKGKGTKTHTLSSAKKGKKSFKKYFTVDKKTGKIKVKKGLKKGTYTVKVKVKAAGNDAYMPATKTVTIKIKVK